MPATQDHGIERVAVPMARELGEVLVQHVVKRVVVGVQRFNVASRVELLHEFPI